MERIFFDDENSTQELNNIIDWYKHRKRRREICNNVAYYMIGPIYMLARWLTR